MFNRSNCDRKDRKSQLSGILTEPLNPRECVHFISCRIKEKRVALYRGCYSGLWGQL